MSVTLMEQETRQSPSVIAKQLQHNDALWQQITQTIKEKQPAFALTIARGSSDHAANFGRYLIETRCKMICASAAPSVWTLYDAKPKLDNALVIAISQSGKSPDICQALEYAKNHGAITLALVNDMDAPLAHIAEYAIDLCAGAEKAVAATKSYIASLVAMLHFCGHYTKDEPLLDTLKTLPEKLEANLNHNWQSAIDILSPAQSTMIVGRGLGYPIAQEAALKLKETSTLHAEAFSSAEILHGPVALVKPEYPILLMPQQDATFEQNLKLAAHLKELGAHLLISAHSQTQKYFAPYTKHILPISQAAHPMLEPLSNITAFYTMANKLSLARNCNPDQPQNLKKVTKTQ